MWENCKSGSVGARGGEPPRATRLGMWVLVGAALAAAGCDGDPSPRTLVVEVAGPVAAPVGEVAVVEATLRMDHPDALAEESRLAIYLPEGPALDRVVSGPELSLSELDGELVAVGIERQDFVPETLIDFQPPGIAPGPQTLTLRASYRCEAEGVADVYVDATFRGLAPDDTVRREERVAVTCGDPIAGADAGP